MYGLALGAVPRLHLYRFREEIVQRIPVRVGRLGDEAPPDPGQRRPAAPVALPPFEFPFRRFERLAADDGVAADEPPDPGGGAGGRVAAEVDGADEALLGVGGFGGQVQPPGEAVGEGGERDALAGRRLDEPLSALRQIVARAARLDERERAVAGPEAVADAPAADGNLGRDFAEVPLIPAQRLEHRQHCALPRRFVRAPQLRLVPRQPRDQRLEVLHGGQSTARRGRRR